MAFWANFQSGIEKYSIIGHEQNDMSGVILFCLSRAYAILRNGPS